MDITAKVYSRLCEIRDLCGDSRIHSRYGSFKVENRLIPMVNHAVETRKTSTHTFDLSMRARTKLETAFDQYGISLYKIGEVMYVDIIQHLFDDLGVLRIDVDAAIREYTAPNYVGKMQQIYSKCLGHKGYGMVGRRVVVYDHLAREGLTMAILQMPGITEIVSTPFDSSNSFFTYLKNHS